MNEIFAVGVNGVVQLLVALLMLLFVLVLCYFTTRFIANYQKGVASKGNIEILEAKGIGNNKLIEIVKIADRYYALGVSKENVTLIDEIDADKLHYEEKEQKDIRESFSQILSKLKKATAIAIIILAVFAVALPQNVYADDDDTDVTDVVSSLTSDGDEDDDTLFGIDISTSGETGGITSALQIVIVLTVIALCPSILIMLTSFTRILIVMHFTRAALGTQTAPPNQILIGISLFLTLFVMSPVINEIYEDAYLPLSNNDITQEEAFEAAVTPLREFMFKNVDDKDLDAMCSIAGLEEVSSQDEIPTRVLIPSFILSELRVAFYIGFLIYVPFLVIDMVVSSTLMSMGMMMLPPTTISMPFKILLFVLADGWNLIIVNLVETIKI